MNFVRIRLSTKSLFAELVKPESNVVGFPMKVKVKNPVAVALGKLGGSRGGKKRAENLSPV